MFEKIIFYFSNNINPLAKLFYKAHSGIFPLRFSAFFFYFLFAVNFTAKNVKVLQKKRKALYNIEPSHYKNNNFANWLRLFISK